MLKLVVKFTAFLTIAIVGLIPVTALIVDDVTVVKVLKEVPSGYKYSKNIIKRKQQIASTINNYVDDTLFQLELIIFEFSGDIFARLQPTILELMDTFLPDRQQVPECTSSACAALSPTCCFSAALIAAVNSKTDI